MRAPLDRRSFLKDVAGAAGLVFVGCGVMNAIGAPVQRAAAARRRVMLKGFRGAAVGGSVAGAELADPKFHPFWAKAEALGAVVFIHPQGTGSAPLAERLKGNGLLSNVIGNPLETTIALSHLIFEGTLDRFPGLKICAAHGGGYLPSYAARSDAVCTTFPHRLTGTLKKKPTEYLRQLYFDSIVFTAEALRHLAVDVHVVLVREAQRLRIAPRGARRRAHQLPARHDV